MHYHWSFPTINIVKTMYLHKYIFWKAKLLGRWERIKLIYDTLARSSEDVESEWRVFRVNEGSFSPDARADRRIDEWSETRAR